MRKKILIMIIILLIISVICIIGIKLIAKAEQEDKNLVATEKYIADVETDSNLKEVTIRNNYYIVQSCIEKFYTCYSEMFEDPLDGYTIKPEEGTVDVEAIKSERIEKVYKLLDDEYLEYKEITLENLTSKLPEIGEISINIQDMYYIEKEDAISLYFVYGTKKDTLDSKTTDFSIMIKLDMKNRTYKILLDDYVEKYYADIEIGKYIEIEEEKIQNDTYNKFSYDQISDTTYINDLFKHYQNILRTSREQSYNLLDEEYKNKCFDSLDDYLSYIDENYLKIVTAKLDKYDKSSNSDYTEYIFKDSKENYYIFKETAPFKYTVLLDNYTIPTEDFVETYNSSADAKKVVLSIKRFFMGIDDKNYGYSYSVLSESFKNNKYPTKNDFVKYVEQNLFEKNEIEYVSYKKQNGLYIYKIIITDATGESNEEKSLNIIVKLNSGTDFEMSFAEE